MIKFPPIPALCLLLAITGCNVSTEQPTDSGVHHPRTEDSSVGTMKEMIVGTWKDMETDNFDAYSSDNTIASEIDEIMTIELSEIGFGEGSISIPIKAKATGNWTLEGDQLTLKYDSVDDVSVGEASLDSDSLTKTLGADFVPEFLKSFSQDFKTEIPSTLCEKAFNRTVVSVDNSLLVLRDESDGEVAQQKRVSPPSADNK